MSIKLSIRNKLFGVKDRIKVGYPRFWNVFSWVYYEWPLFVCLADSEIFSVWWNNIRKGRRALFYQEFPIHEHVLYKMLFLSGYRKTKVLSVNARLSFNWDYETLQSIKPDLEEMALARKVYNIGCKDISKNKVEKIFNEVFGYNCAIDPLIWNGLFVKKSNLNATHDGEILQGPIDNVESHCVYQRVVENVTDNGMVEDIRIPIFRKNIPFTYLKYRPVSSRFSNKNSKIVVVPAENTLSSKEIDLILCFARKMGLDLGEIDAARDRQDGKLYILDVNNTPGGPPNHITIKDWIGSVKKQVQMFRKEFVECEGILENEMAN